MPSLLLKFKRLFIASSCCNSGNNDSIEIVVKESTTRLNSSSTLKDNKN